MKLLFLERPFRKGEPGKTPAPGRGFHPDRLPQNLRRLMVLSAIVSLLFAAIFVWSDTGLGELRRLDRDQAQVSDEIEKLKSENARLRGEIENPSRQRHRIERLAREELGLVRPGEVVLILPATGHPTPSSATR